MKRFPNNGNGDPDFTLWQDRKGLKAVPSSLLAHYITFDILSLDGKDLTKLPLSKRKEILEKTVSNSGRIQTSFWTKNGKALWKLVKKRKLEGIIAKDSESSYHLGRRSDSWLKIKILKTIECIILGFTKEKRIVTSLALGTYQNGKITFNGKVGTGFDEKTIKELHQKLVKIKINKSRAIGFPSDAFAVKPIYVVEVRYQNITRDKRLRAPVFIRLRDDKDTKECFL